MAKVILNYSDTYHGGKTPLSEGIEVRGKNVTIEGVTVECKGIALKADHNCSGLTVRNCTFISSGNNGVKIVADKIEGKNKGLKFVGCKFVGYRMGMELQNHGTPMEPPLDGIPEDWYKIEGVEIENCEFQGTDGKGYALSLTGYGRDVSILYCTFDGRVKGVENAGFSNVSLHECKLRGGKESLITSNKRPMSLLSAHLCQMSGKVYIENASDSKILWSKIDAPYVELKKSKDITLNGNTITSTGTYGVFMNQSSECLVYSNEITQMGNNYSIVRCYGKNAKGNITRDNALSMKKPKKGKWYDQKNGATGNVFENNSTKTFKVVNDGNNT